MVESDNGQSDFDWGPRRLAILQATPWSRLWARALDVNIYSNLILIISVWLFPEFVAQAFWADGAILTLALVPIALLIDALIFLLFDQSIGKAVAGLKLQKDTGARLSFRELASRNLNLWVYGYGLAIPIVSLFTLVAAYLDLDKKGSTHWDRSSSTTVIQSGSSALRTGAALGLTLAMGLLLQIPGFLNAINPLLGISIDINSANKDLPTQIDGSTRFDRLSLSRRDTVVFYYTLIAPDGTAIPSSAISDALRISNFRDQLRVKYCRSDDFAIYKDAHLGIRFVYSLPDGKEALNVRFSSSDCA